MIAPGMDIAAQAAAGRVLNSLPEGVLIAISAWLLLRVMGRQNSGTRFAVWMVALLGVAALPFLGGSGSGSALLRAHAPVTVPALWAIGFSAVWVGVASLALVRVLAGVWQIRRLRQGCTVIPAATLDPSLRDVLRQTKRQVQLLVSEDARVPAAIGFVKPAIVLPAWTLQEMSPAELRPILIHELAHLRRRDDWTNLLQKAVRAVLFFHPAVWWIDGRLSLEREMACDDAVLAETGNPRGYAGCLIGLLEKSCARRGWTMAQAAVARAREASLRIARILQDGMPTSTRVGRGALALAGAACVTCCGVLLYAPRLLVFAPAPDEIAAQTEFTTRYDGRLALPASVPAAEVVPAMFHPVERPALVHRTTMKHTVSSHRFPTRRVAVAAVDMKPHAGSLVRANLLQPQARYPEPLVNAALTQPQVQNRSAVPLVILVAIGQPESGPAGNRADCTPTTLQMTRRAAVEVQTLEIVQEGAAGFRVEIYRVVLVAPVQSAQGAVSQSI